MNRLTLNSFADFIKANFKLLSLEENQVEFYWEDGVLEEGSNKESEEGLHFLDFKYRLVYDIENIKQKHVALLSLLAKQFVSKLKRDDLEELRIEMHQREKDNTLDIELSFGVCDPVHVTEVQNSPIEFRGKKWGIGEHEFFTAEEGELAD